MFIEKITNALAIVVIFTVAATVYGILHDQVTVRICLEYFTVFHPPIFGNQSPTMLAVLWGITATWWIGAFLGCLMAFAACAGQAPMKQARSLILPVLKLLMLMAICAILAGSVGYVLVDSKTTTLSDQYAHLLPPEMYARFAADAWAHNASYLAGLFGGCVIIINSWKSRRSQ